MATYIGDKMVSVGTYVSTDRIVLSKAEYEALEVKDPNIMYMVYDDPTLEEIENHIKDESIHMTSSVVSDILKNIVAPVRDAEGVLSEAPEGWAMIPNDMEIPSSFPFVNITVEGNIVTSMVEAPMPEPAEHPQPKPTIEEEVAALKTAVQMLCLPDKEVS